MYFLHLLFNMKRALLHVVHGLFPFVGFKPEAPSPEDFEEHLIQSALLLESQGFIVTPKPKNGDIVMLVNGKYQDPETYSQKEGDSVEFIRKPLEVDDLILGPPNAFSSGDLPVELVRKSWSQRSLDQVR